MSIPDLTHLQLAVLSALGPNELSGRELRAALEQEAKLKKSGPAFYQMMSRLEDAKCVQGRYEEKVVEGQRIKERRYILTGEGERALRQAVSFYQQIVSQFHHA